MIDVELVSKAFGSTQALSEVTMSARAGEVHAVLGENGAGKSTLMKILAGAIGADAGTMKLDGEAFAPGDPNEARDRGVAIVYQEPQLCPHLTVAENVLLGVEPTRNALLDRKEMRARTDKALRLLLGDDAFDPDLLVSTLSGGDRQMVAIARALAQARCRVLILDEPTSSLTAHDTERLFAAVSELRKRGLCILYISHFLEEVEQIADSYTVLRDGKSVGSASLEGVAMSDIVKLMVGADVDDLFPRSPRERGKLVLSVRELAGVKKPRDASFDLHAGEVLGIAGLVGSGRTELLRAVFGLDAVRAGEIRAGAYIGAASPLTRLGQGIGMLSEDRKGEGLAASMTIADNLTLSLLPRWVWPSRQQADAERWVKRLGIKCRTTVQPVSDLSGGNQQKVALGRMLHHDVDVLLLDEPTRGIDVGSRAEVYRVIDDLAARGRAVLVVSSYLPELFGICDRIAVMRRGTLGKARPVAELDQHAVLLEATGA